MTGHDECNEASYSKDQGRHDKNTCHQTKFVNQSFNSSTGFKEQTVEADCNPSGRR